MWIDSWELRNKDLSKPDKNFYCNKLLAEQKMEFVNALVSLSFLKDQCFRQVGSCQELQGIPRQLDSRMKNTACSSQPSLSWICTLCLSLFINAPKSFASWSQPEANWFRAQCHTLGQSSAAPSSPRCSRGQAGQPEEKGSVADRGILYRHSPAQNSSKHTNNASCCL